MGSVIANTTDVLIVGGGPVGMYLACLLIQQNIGCVVLEKRIDPSTHSRSIGIHPPALRSLSLIGIADDVIAHSIRIRTGRVFSGPDLLGKLFLDGCPPPFPFVLSIPQYRTEAILESRLNQLSPGCLIRGADVVSTGQSEDTATLVASFASQTISYQAKFVVGCDGFRSGVREGSSVPFVGSAYDDAYLMGDFDDETPFGSDAAIFLSPRGVVESFPLPGGKRRWVAWSAAEAAPEKLAEIVLSRTNCPIRSDSCTMISAFTPDHYQADTMAVGRVILAGDSAHVISPIGGQGMNLGWLDAMYVARVISKCLQEDELHPPLLREYSRARLKAAARARRRAEFNMWMGRPARVPALNTHIAKLITKRPFAGYFARRFTMQG